MANAFSYPTNFVGPIPAGASRSTNPFQTTQLQNIAGQLKGPMQGPPVPPSINATPGVDTTNSYADVNAYLDSLAGANASGAGATSGSTTSPYMRPQIRTIAGDTRVYDLLNPTDTKDYYDAIIKGAQGEADKQRTLLNNDYTTSIGTAQHNYEDQKAELADNLAKENQTEADYARDYDTRVNDFNKNYRSGMAARQNAFASADGFQSAQGDSEGMATDAYNKGTTNLGAEKASAQNGFALNRGALDRSGNTLTNNYNDYRTNLQKEVDAKNTALDNYVSEQKANTTSQIAPLNNYEGVKNFDYKLDAYNPTAINHTDLSSLGAATSFNALPATSAPGAASTATGGNGNAFALPAPKTDPLNQYLDYQKTLKTPDPLKSNLYS